MKMPGTRGEDYENSEHIAYGELSLHPGKLHAIHLMNHLFDIYEGRICATLSEGAGQAFENYSGTAERLVEQKLIEYMQKEVLDRYLKVLFGRDRYRSKLAPWDNDILCGYDLIAHINKRAIGIDLTTSGDKYAHPKRYKSRTLPHGLKELWIAHVSLPKNFIDGFWEVMEKPRKSLPKHLGHFIEMHKESISISVKDAHRDTVIAPYPIMPIASKEPQTSPIMRV